MKQNIKILADDTENFCIGKEIIHSYIHPHQEQEVLQQNQRGEPLELDHENGGILPPCKTELFQQFLRANYIASIRNNANEKQPTIFTPENNGWTLEENQYHFHWFDGDELPRDFSESLQDPEEAGSNDNITDDDEDDDLNGQYDWLNDENSNDYSDDDHDE
ncbi:unnamed protein product [Psylliodes chrysocephalus]|uniref:Uncharacterized protein n=1 Tax=Psylliodes chrysocephalus TaxID=3402493 RepID=A0A9P0G6X3_9CUCU|nr:unnamed protein product [Psylliodes chrysocephala]